MEARSRECFLQNEATNFSPINHLLSYANQEGRIRTGLPSGESEVRDEQCVPQGDHLHQRKVATKITDSMARRYVGIKGNDVNGIPFAERRVRSEMQVRAFSTPRGGWCTYPE